MRSEKRKSGIWKGAAAGAAVLAGAVVAWLFVSQSGAEKPGEEPEAGARAGTAARRTARTEAKPREAAKPEKPKEEWITNRAGRVVRKIEEKTYVDERGVLRYEGGARVYDKTKKRTPVNAAPHDPMPHFNHTCEYEIAALLTLEPGAMIFGSRRYDERFKRDFVEALLEPVRYDEDDDESARELKDAVEETKKELAQRIKNGEDLETILTGARTEMQRLAAYKREIEGLVAEQIAGGEASEQDVEDTIEAANAMLESRGIAPLKADAFLRGRLRLERRKNSR